MDYFYELYASYILKRTVELTEDDILSINTEERYVPFARLLAQKAKEITGNGSYLVIIENKKAKEAVEIFSDYLIEKSTTLFIYLQGRDEEPMFENEKIYSAREAQLFGHLASPTILPEASVSFLTIPMPSPHWAKKIFEEAEEKSIATLISDFLGLNSEKEIPSLREAIEIDEYDKLNLNGHKSRKAKLYSDDGMIDLSFSFVEDSRFNSLIFETKNKRRFMPHLFPSSYFRAIDKNSANGHIYTSIPFILFDKVINSAGFEFERGKITSFSSSEEDAERIRTYLLQDEEAANLAEISVTETFSELEEIPLFNYSEWDKLRGIVLTLGSPRSEAVPFKSEDEASSKGVAISLFTLSIPLGTAVTLSVESEDGDEEDGNVAIDPGVSSGRMGRVSDRSILQLNWQNGNLMSTEGEFSDESYMSYAYTEYPNVTPYFDFNVVVRPLFGSHAYEYDDMVSMLYMLRMMGKGSKNLVTRDVVDWGYNMPEPGEPEVKHEDTWAPFAYSFTEDNYLDVITGKCTLYSYQEDEHGNHVSESTSYYNDEYRFVYE